MTATLLRYDRVCAGYGARPVLRDLSFVVEDGISAAILGLNGAGKSTLLRLSVDWLRPTGGMVTVAGIPSTTPGARAALAYLPERFNAPHYLRGREWIALLLAQHGVAYAQERALEECAALALSPTALEIPARQCSRGMLHKLGLIACLLAERRLLVLDEPMAGLDPLARRLCRERLRRARRDGCTLLMTLHDLHDLPLLCDRVLVLHRGSLVFDDTPQALGALHQSGQLEEGLLQLFQN